MEKKQLTGYPPTKKVLVKRYEQTERKSESGLIYSGISSVIQPNESLVLGVGAEIHDIKVGQSVLYPSGTGTEFELDGEFYILLRYEDILIII